MSIEQTDAIDIISTDRLTGHVVLTISDHLDWLDSVAHQLLLQTKLNRYLAFVESGDILESYPDAKGRPVEFKLVFQFPPDTGGQAFLTKVRPIVESAGFKLREEVFTEARWSQPRQQHESETLMNAVLPVAERMLKQYGEFYPYGGCLGQDGSITHIGATDPDTDHPKSRDMLFVLKDSLREMASRGECKAVAVVFDVSTTLPNSCEKSDAIQVNIEHEGGYTAEVFFPYRLAGGEPLYGESLVQQGKHEIFRAD